MEGKILKKYILIPMVFFAPFTKAEVSLKDASYANTWAIVISGGEKKFNLNRKYNSRSLYNGMFGFGWCSNIEVRLQLATDEVSLVQCGQEHKFTAHDGAYYRFGAINEIIVANKSGYEYWQKGKIIYKFGVLGQLTSIFQQDQEYNIEYSSTNSLRITADDYKADIQMFKKFKKIKSISSNRNKFLFSYLNENLVKVEDKMSQWSEEYGYDDLHNLTDYSSSEGEKIQIVYDQDKDQVVSYKDNNCSATYNFEVKETQPNLIYLSSEARDCGAKTEFSQIQFHYKLKGSQRVLATTQSLYQGQLATIHYHPKWGRPTLVLSGTTKYTYSYDKLTGQLISKKKENIE